MFTVLAGRSAVGNPHLVSAVYSLAPYLYVGTVLPPLVIYEGKTFVKNE